MKTYVKEKIILTDGQEYQLKYDARVHITNISDYVSVNVLLKADECENWGIIQEALKTGHMKGADVLLPKGIIKPSGGSIEVLVWY